MSVEATAAVARGAAVKRSRMLGMAAGVALAGAAAWAVARSPAGLSDALAALRAAPAWLIVLGAALPIGSLWLTSVSFWILTARYGRVRSGEMFGLIGAAWLLNYLPLWPGMIGRLAYHTKVNSIALKDSLKALIWANVLGLAAATGHTALVAIGAMTLPGDDWRLAAMGAAPAPLLVLVALYARAKPPAPEPHLWRLLLVLAVRFLEMQVWAGRYWVCFALVGAPLSWGGALAVAGVSQLATTVPLTSNGLGVREWAVGLVAPLLPAALTLRPGLAVQSGLSADLMNRAIEVALAIPVGVVCAWWVARSAQRGSWKAESGDREG